MAAEQFGQNAAEVGGDGEVAAFEQLLLFKTGPLAIDLAALHGAAEHHHHTAVAVVGTGVAVFGGGAAELGHSHQHDVLHPVAHVLGEGRDRR